MNLQPFWERDDAKICSITPNQGNFHCNDTTIKKDYQVEYNHTVYTCTLNPQDLLEKNISLGINVDPDALYMGPNGKILPRKQSSLDWTELFPQYAFSVES